MNQTDLERYAGIDPVAVQKVVDLAAQSKVAARVLARATTDTKNKALSLIAQALRDNTATILAANQKDVQVARDNGMTEGLLDRLSLDPARIEGIAKAVEELIALPDPVGQIIAGQRLPNGMNVRQVRVPLGVVAMIYEARPNVTVDAAALTLKSGNAVLLRGGAAALNSNIALVNVLRSAVQAAGLPAELVASVDEWGREGARVLMRARGLVDVLIPRGGASLIQTTVTESLVPVIETGTGNCHVYVDGSADLQQAVNIVMNAKTQRVGVCNAAETLLVHQDVAAQFLAMVVPQLLQFGVRLHACGQSLQLIPADELVVPATEEDWQTEYLSLDLAVKVVPEVQAACDHIAKYSSGHTEAVLAQSSAVINEFVSRVDSAAIAVNASTRFTDGGQLGLGAEIGISTQKLHARGPMGLSGLTSTTWIMEGQGHIRG